MKSENKLILWLDKHYYISRFLNSRMRIHGTKNHKTYDLYDIEAFLFEMILNRAESRRITKVWYQHAINNFIQKKRKFL